MKRLLFIAVLCMVSGSAFAQLGNIPNLTTVGLADADEIPIWDDGGSAVRNIRGDSLSAYVLRDITIGRHSEILFPRSGALTSSDSLTVDGANGALELDGMHLSINFHDTNRELYVASPAGGDTQPEIQVRDENEAEIHILTDDFATPGISALAFLADHDNDASVETPAFIGVKGNDPTFRIATAATASPSAANFDTFTRLSISSTGLVTITDDLTVSGGEVVFGSTTQDGTLVIHDDDAGGDATVTIQAADATGTSYTLTLPPDDGDAGEQLQTDGAGVLTWEAAGAGGSGTMTTVEEGDTPVGGADIVTLDFLAADFVIAETPDTEINISVQDSGIDHDATTNFLAAEHVDWAGASAGTIHATNYVDNDTQLAEEQVDDFAGPLVATGGTKTLITITYQDATDDMDFVVDNDLANYSNATSDFFDTGGNGLTSVDNTVNVEIKDNAEDAVGSAESVSGLEFESAELTLLQGCSDNFILKWDETADDWNCEADATGAGGSAIVLDLGDDGGDDSVDLNEIATTGDTNNIFTEPSADKLLIAVANNWPTADAADALSANGANCSAGNYPLGVDAAGAVETCTADDDQPDDDSEVPDILTIAGGAISDSPIVLDIEGADQTADGDMDWDTTEEVIEVGDDGVATHKFYPGVHTTEVNDLSAAVTWANVPDANVTGSDERDEVCSTTDLSATCEINADVLDFADVLYTNTLAGNPALAVDELYFVSTATGGGFIAEGSTANTNEQLYLFPDIDDADATYRIAVDNNEVTDLEGTGLSITTGTLNAATADATTQGIVELATTAETTTGTDATRAVTPDGLEDGFDGSANITTLGTITTGTWQGTTVAVDQGGTGAVSLTDGGILLGSGTGAITALGAATNGQIPIGDGTTDPVLATISGTANEIEITNGAGSITVGIPDSPTIVTPTIASFTNATHDHADAAGGGTLTITDTECVYLEDPTAADDLQSLDANKTAGDWTLTEIWGESDQTVNFDLQIDDGTPADVNGTDISPAAGEAEDTSLSGDVTLAAGEELDLAITSVSGTPTWVAICWTYTRGL